MPEVIVLVLAACATTLATGLGAIPVFMLGRQRAAAAAPFLLGLAIGVMGVAALLGLLAPALDEGSTAAVLAGVVVGLAFLWLVARRFDEETPFMGRTGPGARTSGLVFLVLFVHSLPEGLAIGTAFASERAGLSLFVILAIGIQNVPEGTSVAIPMAEAGFSRGRQFWAAVATSSPQPVGAVAAYVLVQEVRALLPFSFAFAAGAMLGLIVAELLPKAYAGGRRVAPTAGAALGGAAMVALDLLLGV